MGHAANLPRPAAQLFKTSPRASTYSLYPFIADLILAHRKDESQMEKEARPTSQEEEKKGSGEFCRRRPLGLTL